MFVYQHVIIPPAGQPLRPGPGFVVVVGVIISSTRQSVSQSVSHNMHVVTEVFNKEAGKWAAV